MCECIDQADTVGISSCLLVSIWQCCQQVRSQNVHTTCYTYQVRFRLLHAFNFIFICHTELVLDFDIYHIPVKLQQLLQRYNVQKAT